MRIGSYLLQFNDPFENLVLLSILIIVTVFAYFALVYFRGKRASHFGNLKTLERVHGFKRFHISPMILIVKILIVSMLFIAATDTIQIGKFQPKADTDYVLLLDASPSMSKQDYNPNRLTAAKDLANEWISILPNSTQVGLVAFSSEIEAIYPPTFDKRAIRQEIESISIDYSKSGTAPDFALGYALELFNESTRNKAILLFTDGTNEVSNTTLAIAKQQNVQVYAFGIGGDADVRIIDDPDIPEEFLDLYDSLEFNFEVLQRIADETGGRAYQVGNTQELALAFQQVTYEQTRISVDSTYYILLLIAILSIFELLVYAIYGGI